MKLIIKPILWSSEFHGIYFEFDEKLNITDVDEDRLHELHESGSISDKLFYNFEAMAKYELKQTNKLW